MTDTLIKYPCAVPDCSERLTKNYHMCTFHFRSMPLKMRRAIWQARSTMEGTDSPEYKAALIAGVKYVTEHGSKAPRSSGDTPL